jgi:hypothetical protein
MKEEYVITRPHTPQHLVNLETFSPAKKWKRTTTEGAG